MWRTFILDNVYSVTHKQLSHHKWIIICIKKKDKFFRNTESLIFSQRNTLRICHHDSSRKEFLFQIPTCIFRPESNLYKMSLLLKFHNIAIPVNVSTHLDFTLLRYDFRHTPYPMGPHWYFSVETYFHNDDKLFL